MVSCADGNDVGIDGTLQLLHRPCLEMLQFLHYAFNTS